MAKTRVELIALECTVCVDTNGVHQRNYTTKKNRQNTQGRLELRKYCKYCRCHTIHRETRIK